MLRTPSRMFRENSRPISVHRWASARSRSRSSGERSTPARRKSRSTCSRTRAAPASRPSGSVAASTCHSSWSRPRSVPRSSAACARSSAAARSSASGCTSDSRCAAADADPSAMSASFQRASTSAVVRGVPSFRVATSARASSRDASTVVARKSGQAAASVGNEVGGCAGMRPTISVDLRITGSARALVGSTRADPAGRHRAPGPGEHRDRLPRAQRHARRLGCRRASRCSPPSTCSATSGRRSLTTKSVGLVGLVVPELTNPVFPAFVDALEQRAVRAAVHAAAVHAVAGRHPRGPVRRRAPASTPSTGSCSSPACTRTPTPTWALPPAARTGRADRAGQRVHARHRRPVRVAPTTPSRSTRGRPPRRAGPPPDRPGHRPERFVPARRKIAAFSAALVAARAVDGRAPRRTSAPRCTPLEGGQAAATDLLGLRAHRDRLRVGPHGPRGDPGGAVGGPAGAGGRLGRRVRRLAAVEFTDPPLTTVRQPVEAICRAAVDALIAEMRGDAQ